MGNCLPAGKRRKVCQQPVPTVVGTGTVESSKSAVRWNDLHLDLIHDIFKHIPTMERVKYRRVSSIWKEVLDGQSVELTSVLVLRRADLQCWKNFCQNGRPIFGMIPTTPTSFRASSLLTRKRSSSTASSTANHMFSPIESWKRRSADTPNTDSICRSW